MKKILLLFLLLAGLSCSYGQGTLQRVINTTSAQTRSMLTNETVAEWLISLGIPPSITNNYFAQFQSIITQPTNIPGVVGGGTNYWYPAPVMVLPGSYLVSCALYVGATNTEIGFSNTNLSSFNLIGSSVSNNYFAGVMTVTDLNAYYGFYVRQSVSNSATPYLGSNSVAWLYKLK